MKGNRIFQNKTKFSEKNSIVFYIFTNLFNI